MTREGGAEDRSQLKFKIKLKKEERRWEIADGRWGTQTRIFNWEREL